MILVFLQIIIPSFIGAGLAYYFALSLAKRQFIKEFKLKAMFATIDALHDLDKNLVKANYIWIDITSAAEVIVDKPEKDGQDLYKIFLDDLGAFAQTISENESIVSPIYFYQTLSGVQTKDIENITSDLQNLAQSVSSLAGCKSRREKIAATISNDKEITASIRAVRSRVITHLGLVNHIDLVPFTLGKKDLTRWKKYVDKKFYEKTNKN